MIVQKWNVTINSYSSLFALDMLRGSRVSLRFRNPCLKWYFAFASLVTNSGT